MKNETNTLGVKKLLIITLISSSLLLVGCFKKEVVPVPVPEIKKQAQENVQTGSMEVSSGVVEEVGSGSIDTTSGQKYSDEKMGISFILPLNWVGGFRKVNNDENNISFDASRDGIEFGKNTKLGDYSITILTYDINSVGAKNFIDRLKEKNSNEKIIKLNSNIDAFRTVIESPYPENEKENGIIYNFIAENKYFEISISYNGNGKSDGVGDKIVSTIEFLKEANSNPVNQKYSYEIKKGGKKIILYLIKEGKKIKVKEIDDEDGINSYIDNIEIIGDIMVYNVGRYDGYSKRIYNINSMNELGQFSIGELTKDKKYVYSCIDDFIGLSVEVFNLKTLKTYTYPKKDDSVIANCLYEFSNGNHYLKFTDKGMNKIFDLDKWTLNK